MTLISVRHLRYFEALARHGHFGRAAEACAISQPALSVQIKELEEMLGAVLVERGGRQIRLTSLGEEVATRARAILAAIDELPDIVRAASGAMGGRLRLGVIPTIAPYLLPRVLAALQREAPEVEVRPREAITSRLIDDLVEGQLDAALVALPLSEPSLHEQPLFEEPFCLVRPLAEADRPLPSAETLRDQRLLLLEEGHCFRDQALSFCQMSPARMGDVIEGSSLATLVQLVAAGLGVTLIPQMAIDVEAAAAAVTVAPLPAPTPMRTIGLVWRRTSLLAEQLGRLADVIRAAAMTRNAP